MGSSGTSSTCGCSLELKNGLEIVVVRGGCEFCRESDVRAAGMRSCRPYSVRWCVCVGHLRVLNFECDGLRCPSLEGQCVWCVSGAAMASLWKCSSVRKRRWFVLCVGR